MELENIILSEVTQSQKNTHSIHLQGVSLPILPPLLPSPQESHSLGVQLWQDQGLPLPLVPLLGYSLLPMQLEPRVSPCIVFG